MRSTFMGLETARRGLVTQQSALYTTGHNISNANTLGYSRQRVNFTTTSPYPTVGLNRPQLPGQMGTGVEAGSVQRVRNAFLDVQYRNESNKLGYWESRANALSKMEDIMNEPSEDGISAVMNEFWQSLQDLSGNPENDGARKVVLQRGQAVADTFHYVHDSLTTIKDDLGNEIGVTIKEINSLLKQIGEINKQISEIEPHGYLTNDLYDARDLLVDELSQHMNISVERKPSGGNALPNAEGLYDIKMLDARGNSYSLVSGKDHAQIGIDGTTSDVVTGPLTSITVVGSDGSTNSITASMGFPQGNLKGLIESYGYNDGGIKGIYPEMLDNLDKLAYTFANVFNEVHSLGFDLKGNKPTKDFFDGITGTYVGAAKNIKLGSLQPADVAASTQGDAGDGKHAINLGNIMSMDLTKTSQDFVGIGITVLTSNSEIKSGTINSFYEGMIGKLGVDALQANRLSHNSVTLKQSVEERRQSESSVSLDEEMTNMIKFQHAYNASARQITVIDEILDKIINGMGTVGR